MFLHFPRHKVAVMPLQLSIKPEKKNPTGRMTESRRTFAHVRDVILSAHRETDIQDKVGFYNDWAGNYEQDVALLEYRAPALASACLCAAFQGDRQGALVLDVACGTGLVSAQLKKEGFSHFIGVDGSCAMLEEARSKGLYQDLKQCILGAEPLPVQTGTCDVVLIVGALSVGQVPVGAVRELWKAAKAGGYICMTTRTNAENQEYQRCLEATVAEMEADGMWRRESRLEVEEWERAVSQPEDGYIPGLVYLYRKCPY